MGTLTTQSPVLLPLPGSQLPQQEVLLIMLVSPNPTATVAVAKVVKSVSEIKTNEVAERWIL